MPSRLPGTLSGDLLRTTMHVRDAVLTTSNPCDADCGTIVLPSMRCLLLGSIAIRSSAIRADARAVVIRAYLLVHRARGNRSLPQHPSPEWHPRATVHQDVDLGDAPGRMDRLSCGDSRLSR